jgi:hypothetical protein
MSGVDTAPEPISYKLGDTATMINMGMREYQAIDIRRIEVPVVITIPIAPPGTLEKATVEKNLVSIIKYDEVCTTGNISGCTTESYFHITFFS